MDAKYSSEELGRLFLCLNNKYHPPIHDSKWVSTKPGQFIQHMRTSIRDYNHRCTAMRSPVKEKKLMSDHEIKQAYLDPDREYEGIDRLLSDVLDTFGVDIGVKVIASGVEEYMGVSSDFVPLKKSGRKLKKQFTVYLNPAYDEFKSFLEEVLQSELS